MISNNPKLKLTCNAFHDSTILSTVDDRKGIQYSKQLHEHIKDLKQGHYYEFKIKGTPPFYLDLWMQIPCIYRVILKKWVQSYCFPPPQKNMREITPNLTTPLKRNL